MSDIVLAELRSGTLVVTLNRPSVLNAVNRALREALIARLTEAEADPAVKAVVLTGAGKAFSAGQDLAEAAATDASDIRAWCDSLRAMYQSVRALSKPTIAAFNGIAAGAGMQMGLCADLRITHATARIGQPEVKAGIASVVGSYLMSLYVGHGANRELSLSGGLVSGEQAFALGLVNRIVPEGEVLDTALMFAEELRRVPQAAFRLTKQRFREQTQPGFDEATAYGVRAMLEAFATGEPQRVMRAFIEAREQRKGRG